MQMFVVRTVCRMWGIDEHEIGAHALQCCGAAGGELEARGEDWGFREAVEAYALLRNRNVLEVRAEMAALCRRHRLPSPQKTAYFLAEQAARLEAEAAGFQKRGRAKK